MVELGNAGQVRQRQPMSISELLPYTPGSVLPTLSFDVIKNLSEEQLLAGLSGHAEISGDVMVYPAVAKAGVTRAATMKPGAPMLERVHAVHGAFVFFSGGEPECGVAINIATMMKIGIEARRMSLTRLWRMSFRPRSLRRTSSALLRSGGKWNNDPAVQVFKVMVEDANDWKNIEKVDEGRQARGGARTVGGKPDTEAKRSGGAQDDKSGSSGACLSCHKPAGHYARDCRKAPPRKCGG